MKKVKKQKITVTKIAENLEDLCENWISSNSPCTIEEVIEEQVRKLTSDPILQVAGMLKFDFVCEGLEDKDWIETAKQFNRLLGEKS